MAGVEYAIEFIEGRTDGRLDEEVLSGIVNEIAGGEGKAGLTKYNENGVQLDNYYMILCDFYDFGA